MALLQYHLLHAIYCCFYFKNSLWMDSPNLAMSHSPITTFHISSCLSFPHVYERSCITALLKIRRRSYLSVLSLSGFALAAQLLYLVYNHHVKVGINAQTCGAYASDRVQQFLHPNRDLLKWIRLLESPQPRLVHKSKQALKRYLWNDGGSPGVSSFLF